MPHYPADHCAKIGVLYHHATENVKCENTFFVEDPTDAIFADAAGFAAQVYAAVLADLVPHSSSEVVYDGISFEDIRVLPYGGGDFAFGPDAGTATSTGDSLPTDTAFAVKKLTAGLGRSARGRWYFPVWNAAWLASADQLNSGFAAGTVAALSAFQAAVEGGALPVSVGIVSFQIGGGVRNPGVFQRITSWDSTDAYVDSQRRRLLGRGR